MEPFVLAAVAFVCDGALLTVRKAGTERYLLPGGKLEPGESPLQAAVREVAEEIGLDVEELTELGVYSAAAANEPGRSLVSTVYVGELTGEPRACGEIAELRWSSLVAPPADLAPLLAEHVVPALLARR
ncbi:NUDIX domain-containing protein [Nocardioides sp. GY 10127]|uniref:NUDIX hydrolase n=1 Tax=Nocardioides sp. GY 10127 TaxID=2569762 RepID=UPI0023EF527A|nr:NUDIX domain-containing protein [Nocardioides sp. GY 10127]